MRPSGCSINATLMAPFAGALAYTMIHGPCMPSMSRSVSRDRIFERCCSFESEFLHYEFLRACALRTSENCFLLELEIGKLLFIRALRPKEFHNIQSIVRSIGRECRQECHFFSFKHFCGIGHGRNSFQRVHTGENLFFSEAEGWSSNA
eukprot:Gb_33219 [translate_table: standard]